ncbi:MAG: hypothetical protein EZS28_002171 [Streblomastix strix]|uniref:Uncharacterized protein n=1 Tax=Streblomastix strix TaxID=222440 RepID=A0A5J4X4R6_9EUKA|nr:MAG: hypothetical protein EZS28_002171 [Streblomastix strix]
MDRPTRQTGEASITDQLRTQVLADSDATSQIILHASRLRLREVSDLEKSQSLERLLVLSIIFDKNQWKGIVTDSGVIESLSGLMFKTSNPKIRTMCGTLLELVEQRGSESGEIVDWRSLISPLMTLLFNKDEKISETGKQSLIKAYGVKQEVLKGLVELGIIEKTAELLERMIPSQFYQQTLSSQAVLLNVLEIVDKLLKSDVRIEKGIKQLRKVVERLVHQKLPKSINLFIQQIQLIIKQEDPNDDKDDVSEQDNSEVTERIQIAEERAYSAEERAHAAEE